MDRNERPQQKCMICDEILPEARLPLICSGCGSALHPSCAARIERGPSWGSREMFCAACAGNRASVSKPMVAR